MIASCSSVRASSKALPKSKLRGNYKKHSPMTPLNTFKFLCPPKPSSILGRNRDRI
jgi:hypothetical protein